MLEWLKKLFGGKKQEAAKEAPAAAPAAPMSGSMTGSKPEASGTAASEDLK